MTPKDGDVVVKGKKGLDAFPGTTLEEELKARGIETVALAGFLTNCCAESTMRTAYEKGFNVITLTDCVATTSDEGQKAATTGTYGMFSSPMTSGEFKEKLTKADATKRPDEPAAKPVNRPPLKPRDLEPVPRDSPAFCARCGAGEDPEHPDAGTRAHPWSWRRGRRSQEDRRGLYRVPERVHD